MSNYDKAKAKAYDKAVNDLLDAKSSLNTSYFLSANPQCYFPEEGEEVRELILEFIQMRKNQLRDLENALDNWYKMGEAGWHVDAYEHLKEMNRQMDEQIARNKAERMEEAK